MHLTTWTSYTSKIIDFNDYGKKVQFQIWDTDGQEKYKGLTKIFHKDAKIVILVYDITKRQSFDKIKKYWRNQIKDNSSEEISKKIFYIIIY